MNYKILLREGRGLDWWGGKKLEMHEDLGKPRTKKKKNTFTRMNHRPERPNTEKRNTQIEERRVYGAAILKSRGVVEGGIFRKDIRPTRPQGENGRRMLLIGLLRAV